MLHSPLIGTVGVLAGLGLLAIPLHRLTSTPSAPALVQTAAPAASATPALLRLKLLAPAALIRLKTEDGTILLELTNVPAGESEHEANLPLHDDLLELTLETELNASSSNTAVFLTVMPDGHEEQTRYLIGAASVTEPLAFDWGKR